MLAGTHLGVYTMPQGGLGGRTLSPDGSWLHPNPRRGAPGVIFTLVAGCLGCFHSKYEAWQHGVVQMAREPCSAPGPPIGGERDLLIMIRQQFVFALGTSAVYDPTWMLKEHTDTPTGKRD